MGHLIVTIEGREFAVRRAPDGRVEVDGLPVEVLADGRHRFAVLGGGRAVPVVAAGAAGSYDVLVEGAALQVRVETERDRLLRRYAGAGAETHRRLEVRAPMPALVVRLEAAVGDEVPAGGGLVVLEAMKMENELKAHQAGRVREIHVRPGQAVEKGALLLSLE